MPTLRMHPRVKQKILSISILYLCLALAAIGGKNDLAKEIISSSGINAGVCVCLDVTDVELMTSLYKNGNFVVQGLASNQETVKKAQAYIQSKGIYGDVSVIRHPLLRLPYANNIINLLVSDDLSSLLGKGLELKEIIRVLCPGGVAYLALPKDKQLDIKTLKDKLNKNDFSEFKIIKRFGAWLKIKKAVPETTDYWTHPRHAPDGNSVSQDTAIGPPKQLQWLDGPTWKRSHKFKQSSVSWVAGEGRLFHVTDHAPTSVAGPWRFYLIARDAYNGFILWRKLLPMTKKHRRPLIVDGSRLYTSIDEKGTLVCLNAATGELLHRYDNAGPARELILQNNKLIVLNGSSIRVLDSETGKLLWKHKADNRTPIVSDKNVFLFFRGKSLGKNKVICLDIDTGKQLWETEVSWEALFCNGICCYNNGVIVLTGTVRPDKDKLKRKFHAKALSAKDGKLLWEHTYIGIEHLGSPDNIFFIDNLLWFNEGREFISKKKYRYHSNAWVGLDPLTGVERKRIADKYSRRSICARNKATKNYILSDMLHMVNIKTGQQYFPQMAREGCYLFGILPSNGLIYVPANACVCLGPNNLRGYFALSQDEVQNKNELKTKKISLEKGPAFGKVKTPSSVKAPEKEWANFRHDNMRRGSTLAEVSGKLKPLWESNPGGRLSAPTIAGGKVFVSSIDKHKVFAYDKLTGKLCWTYTADARVDSPPTLYKGLCIFGSMNGTVYCLRSDDGQLVWRLDATPAEHHIMAFGQLESSWPVHGSVLVKNDLIVFAAGRSGKLNNIYVQAVKSETGEVVWKTTWDAGVNGLLTIPNENVSMEKDVKFNPVSRGHMSGRLYSMRDLLDSRWPARAPLRYGGFEADLLVFNADRVYGINAFASAKRRKNALNTPGTQYQLFCGKPAEIGEKEFLWSKKISIRVTAMVLAGDILFCAGAPDMVASKDWSTFAGEKGARLIAFAAKDGKKISELKMNALPVYDGMAATEGQLFLSSKDGKLHCFSGPLR